MTDEFEKMIEEYEAKHLTGSSGLVRKIARHFYDARQPQIDDLIRDNNWLHENLEKEGNRYFRILELLGMEEEGDPVARVEQLLAENERLRKAAEDYLAFMDRDEDDCLEELIKFINQHTSALRAALEEK